ncbi:hypothetical protein [Thalassotalea montiporae]
MQIINHWPNVDEVGLPEEVASELINFLVEPFACASEAQAFWQECPSTIIVLYENTNLAEISGSIRQSISFCLNYPEFEEALPNGYRLLLAIINDEGTGCYLVLPSSLDMTEVMDG